MYRVLIVDDEEPARETLRFIIDWDETAFGVEGVAKNGRQALELFESIKPDLIITDIQMPVMDGLQFIKEVKKRNKHQKFVILSCHENFNYAKEAIGLGVSDYLLKDLLTPQDLYSLLEKTKFELEEERKINTARLVTQKDNGCIVEWKNAVLQKLIFSEEHEKDTEALMHRYHLRLTSKDYVMMCIVIDDYLNVHQNLDRAKIKKKRNAIIRAINITLNDEKCGECFFDKKGTYIAIAGTEDTKSEYDFIKNCYAIANRIHKHLKESMNIQVTIGVSSRFSHLCEVKKWYDESMSMVQYRVFLGKGKTILYNVQLSQSGNLNMELIEKHLDEIKNVVNKKDFNKVEELIIQIYRKDITGFVQYNYLKYINSRILGLILEYCTKNNIDLQKVFGCRYLPVEKLEEFETIEEMTNWFLTIFNKMDHIYQEKLSSKYSKHVQDAIDYILQNSKKRIGLTHISEELCLNKAYLCRIFKNETGETLTDYINHIRIKDAKELIQTTSFKMYEIAEYVGFTNIQHFNNTFKKITGESPMRFRNQN